MTKQGLMMGAALAGLMIGSGAQADHHEGHPKKSEKKAAPTKAQEVSGQCWGVNSCKGTGACGGVGSHNCKGMNTCKGKGWVKKTEKECQDLKGTFKEA